MIPGTLDPDLQAGRTSSEGQAREYLLKARAALDGARLELADLGGDQRAALGALIAEVTETARALEGEQPRRAGTRLARPRLRR